MNGCRLHPLPRGRDLIQIKAGQTAALQAHLKQWEPIASAPFGRELELAVLDDDGAHALAFACRRAADGWIDARTRHQIDVRPTHWREWNAER
jgi:hypothetical protein